MQFFLIRAREKEYQGEEENRRSRWDRAIVKTTNHPTLHRSILSPTSPDFRLSEQFSIDPYLCNLLPAPPGFETLLPHLSSPRPLETTDSTTGRLASLGIPGRRRQHLENGDDNIKACSQDVLVAVPTADDR
ncbi:hypothetical protein RRG08_014211 [Elysia crispata]|uniref:Uncharacterized protein n=1 Tax=Elysia crispata TaxID=231223 RepID=A0AAE1CF04_9GAST|nr:hypothetical protein RRG08_014211 [Elysia crispata]